MGKFLTGSMTLLTEPVSLLLSVGGTELTDSRRFVDLTEMQAVRVQYKAGGAMTVRVEYSTDFGISWSTLISETSIWVGSGNPYCSQWVVIPDSAKQNEVTLRAIGVGSGVLVGVTFVEFNYR